jgi:nucleoside-diphosphate-sugar epimerase
MSEGPPRSEVTLVTGITGFIGSRVASRWLERGRPVRGLVRGEASIPDVETVRGDLLDHDSLRRAADGVGVVVHCAVDESEDPIRARRINEGGSRALAEAALAGGCRRFVHISTCGAYALEGLDLVDEETPLWPDERIDELVYGATKAMAERAVADVAAKGLGVVILRPPNVLGAHPRSWFCEALAVRVRNGEVGYAGDGGNTWPYVHIENLVDAIESAVERDVPPGRAYTVVDGHTTWRAFLETYGAWLGRPIPAREAGPIYDAFHGHFATDRVREELGYEPQRSYEDAMEETRRFLEHVGILGS